MWTQWEWNHSEWMHDLYLCHLTCCWLKRNRYFLQGKGYLWKPFYLSNLAERLTRHIECFPARFVRKWPNLVFGCFPRHWVNSGGRGDRKGATGKEEEGGLSCYLLTQHLRCYTLDAETGVYNVIKRREEISIERFTKAENIISTE